MAHALDPKSAVLTIKAAAEVLGVSEQTLRRWDKAGKLSPHRNPMNGYRLYARREVLELKNRIYGASRTAA
jgi:excisionase family DNA binding protein